MNDPSLMGYPNQAQQQQQQQQQPGALLSNGTTNNLSNGSINPLHQQIHMNNPMPPPGIMNPNDMNHISSNFPQMLEQLNNGMNMNTNNSNNNTNALTLNLHDNSSNNNNANNLANAIGMNSMANNTSPALNSINLNSLNNAPGGSTLNTTNATTTAIKANANNPLFHPHLEDPALLNNPIWKLQLQLAAVSLQSLGQPNVYARQNAMKKYLASQNPTHQQHQVQQQQQQQGKQQQGLGSQPSSQPQSQLPPSSSQQQQIPEASMSLVDRTKQLLMDIALETSKEKSTNNKGAPIPPHSAKGGPPNSAASNNITDSIVSSATNTPTATSNNSTLSTPTTPHIELNNLRDGGGGVAGINVTPTSTSALLQHKKLSQYNIDEDDEIENRMVAPKDTKYNDQLWHAIDFSNLQIFNINQNLFKYNFLTRLYLNGNGLTTLPEEIKNLTNLCVLDLSNNRLTELPVGLGSCFRLKYLYFFNNLITNLPWELGNLYNLQFLGCEGNPLDKQLLKILTEKSFTGLIFYLRDNRPEIPLTHDREFIEINADGEPTRKYDSLQLASANINPDLEKKSFTILSYNTLCQHYATPKMYRYTPSWALSWDYRREKLKEQILSYQSDILCLQEVESKTFEEFWGPLLEKYDYQGVFHIKTRAKTMQTKESKKVDGCCIFFKKSKFKLLAKEAMDFSGTWMKHKKFQRTEDYLNRAMNKDNVALYMKLQSITSGETVWVVTTHLHWDPKFNDVKTFQVGILLDHMETLLKEENPKQDVKKANVVICGDLNSYLDSAVYELFTTGRVVNHQDNKGRDFGYMTQKHFAHNLSLKSSYNCIGELPFTNFTPSFTDVIDYIWFSTQSLRVRGLLGEVDPDYAAKFVGFPNDKFPSDHIPLLARFEFVKSSSGSRKI
ncbi:CCR4-NOT core exoribonuclease subunit CCR4 NDAI_0H02520 [Naumovozyma dairenensis CBS 421]|uniref:CCR4-Not complex 3'-5'-exoribonuclease subunit Ccr4 n=1 Tax=Naumovozyma dairenensis (strain ATCC 10597 / BCRC 20456 / CBS 421 / NBRC 0211 / NRRL Y-12639) TaxID=1071378 RepID=G0WF65_NAUDC|nr:hypothetical protein NDAI_0H02520 [Naumovozyma dairenensis CBS 421]CCD26426.1 hypothetical protein NDAI_0H02520 [Naumovozyma dairenensis CBS 421]